MSVNFTPPGATSKNPYQGPAFSLANAGFDPATFDQRAIAWTLDMLLIAALQKGLELFDPEIGKSGLILVASILYFVLSQFYFDCTAGKYFVGLRVHLTGGESNKFLKLLFRETLGRGLSGLVLGFGYLAILFSGERASWHDRLSGTQVVSLSPVNSSTFGLFVRGVASLMLATVLLVGGAVGMFLFSSQQIEALQSQLLLAGIHLTGVRGNMMNGFEIDKLSYEKDGNILELNGIRVMLDPRSAIPGSREFRLKHLMVESGLIRVTSPLQKRDKVNPPQPNTKTPEKPAVAKREISPFRLRVDQVDISSIVVEGMDQRFELTRFFISEIQTVSKPFQYSMGRLYIDSSNFSIDVPKLEYANEKLVMVNPVHGSVKAASLPGKLKRDLTFSVNMTSLKSFEAKLFNSQMRISMRDKMVDIAIRDWSPSNYFEGHWPISRINLSGQGELRTARLSGDYRLRQTKIKIPEQLAMVAFGALVGQEEVQAAVKPAMIMLTPMIHKQGGSPWLKFADATQSEAESLSMLYYKRKMESLNDAEKAAVNADLAFFSTPLFPSSLKRVGER